MLKLRYRAHPVAIVWALPPISKPATLNDVKLPSMWLCQIKKASYRMDASDKYRKSQRNVPPSWNSRYSSAIPPPGNRPHDIITYHVTIIISHVTGRLRTLVLVL